MRPVLVGEAPSRAGDRYHAFPLSGNPAQRICGIMGWKVDGPAYWTLVEHFETVNAIERYGDAYPWSVVTARNRMDRWLVDNGCPRVVVCVGRRAADAIRLPSAIDFGVWVEADNPDGGPIWLVALPHTSARARAWNDPATAGLYQRVLTEALELAGNSVPESATVVE